MAEVVDAPAVWTYLDMEMQAAKQLMELSGGGGGGGRGELESRTSDSVKFHKVETGDVEVIVGGHARRRRPRFRSLAAIYRETGRLAGDECHLMIRAAACKKRGVVHA